MQRCRAWKCYRRRTDAVDDERYLYVNNFSVGYDTYRIWGLSSCLHELSDGNQNTTNLNGNPVGPCRAPFCYLSDEAVAEIARTLEADRAKGMR